MDGIATSGISATQGGDGRTHRPPATGGAPGGPERGAGGPAGSGKAAPFGSPGGPRGSAGVVFAYQAFSLRHAPAAYGLTVSPDDLAIAWPYDATDPGQAVPYGIEPATGFQVESAGSSSGAAAASRLGVPAPQPAADASGAPRIAGFQEAPGGAVGYSATLSGEQGRCAWPGVGASTGTASSGTTSVATSPTGFTVTAGMPTLVSVSATFSTTVVPVAATSATLTDVLYLQEAGTTAPISVYDINQGQIGDCFLLSSIGEIALWHPSAIMNMIQANANGTETVTLYLASNGSLPNFGTTSYEATTITVTNTFLSDGVNSGATQDVQAAINAAAGVLPKTLPYPPTYAKVNPADAPVLTLALPSETISLRAMSDLADTLLAQRLAQISGVGRVAVLGGLKPAVRVQADLARLAAYGIAMEDLRSAIAGANVS